MDFSFLFLLTYHKAVGHYGKSLGLYHIAISIHGLLRITTLSVWEECNAEQASLLYSNSRLSVCKTRGAGILLHDASP